MAPVHLWWEQAYTAQAKHQLAKLPLHAQEAIQGDF